MGDSAWFIPNYTGPFISNGKFQTSVEFGDRAPKDSLDALSRLHDSAYAKYRDSKQHRMAADEIYADEAHKLGTITGHVAGLAVRYGNHLQDAVRHIVGEVVRQPALPVLGLLKGGVDVVRTYTGYRKRRDDLRRDVVRYYGADPFPHLQHGRRN